MTACILQTVDVYDALTTARPYRRALPPNEAFAILHEEVRRGWWNAALIRELEVMIHSAAPVSATTLAP